jgi:hypothetical protein
MGYDAPGVKDNVQEDLVNQDEESGAGVRGEYDEVMEIWIW